MNNSIFVSYSNSLESTQLSRKALERFHQLKAQQDRTIHTGGMPILQAIQECYPAHEAVERIVLDELSSDCDACQDTRSHDTDYASEHEVIVVDKNSNRDPHRLDYGAVFKGERDGSVSVINTNDADGEGRIIYFNEESVSRCGHLEQLRKAFVAFVHHIEIQHASAIQATTRTINDSELEDCACVQNALKQKQENATKLTGFMELRQVVDAEIPSVPLVEIIQLISRQKKSGILSLHGNHPGRIGFSDGQVIHIAAHGTNTEGLENAECLSYLSCGVGKAVFVEIIFKVFTPEAWFSKGLRTAQKPQRHSMDDEWRENTIRLTYDVIRTKSSVHSLETQKFTPTEWDHQSTLLDIEGSKHTRTSRQESIVPSQDAVHYTFAVVDTIPKQLRTTSKQSVLKVPAQNGWCFMGIILCSSQEPKPLPKQQPSPLP